MFIANITILRNQNNAIAATTSALISLTVYHGLLFYGRYDQSLVVNTAGAVMEFAVKLYMPPYSLVTM